MKRLLLLFLVLAPHSARAEKVTPVATTQTDKLPDAQDLLDGLFDVYEGARTFRGTFDVQVLGRQDPKARMTLAYSFNIQTVVRYNEAGDLSGEASRLDYRNSDPAQNQTLFFVDDGQKARTVFEQQRAWQESGHATAPLVRQILQPVVEEMVRGLREQDGFNPKVSRGKDAGRSTFVVRAKMDGGSFRVVLDAQTHAIRLIQLDSDLNSLTLRGTNQTFDVPVTATEFAWTPAPELRQVQPGEIALPQALRAAQQPPAPDEAPAPPAGN